MGGDDSVRVDPLKLATWGAETAADVTTEQSQLTGAYTGISQNTLAAFARTVPGTHPFAEGQSAMNLVMRNMQDFRDFLQDVSTGATAIQNASMAMAVAYATTDGDQANSLNAVDFAFADGGTSPDGFPQHGISTMFDQEQAAAAASGQNTTAAYAAQDYSFLQYATDAYAVNGGVMYTFGDGSRLMVTKASSGSLYISDDTTTSSIFRPGDKAPASVITTGQSTDYSGQPTTSKTTQTLTTDGKYVTSSESTTQLANGSTQVTTTTTGADGKSQTQSINVPKATPDTGTGSDLGEIEKLELQYDTQGSTEYFKYGRT